MSERAYKGNSTKYDWVRRMLFILLVIAYIFGRINYANNQLIKDGLFAISLIFMIIIPNDEYKKPQKIIIGEEYIRVKYGKYICTNYIYWIAIKRIKLELRKHEHIIGRSTYECAVINDEYVIRIDGIENKRDMINYLENRCRDCNIKYDNGLMMELE